VRGNPVGLVERDGREGASPYDLQDIPGVADDRSSTTEQEARDMRAAVPDGPGLPAMLGEATMGSVESVENVAWDSLTLFGTVSTLLSIGLSGETRYFEDPTPGSDWLRQSLFGSERGTATSLAGASLGLDPESGAWRLGRNLGTAAQIAFGFVQVGRNAAGRVVQLSDEVFHATMSREAAEGVLSGINPAFFNAGNRFGRAFYVAADDATAVAEVASHGNAPAFLIRFEFDLSRARILDLTDPATADTWGYLGGEITEVTQAIGGRAMEAGFNAIRFPSVRADGINLAVLSEWEDLLLPQMVYPASP